VADAGLGELARKDCLRVRLRYKTRWSGTQVVQIDGWYSSSKTYSECRYVNEELTLGDREWTCPECGALHDPDHNAAKNTVTVRQDTSPEPLQVVTAPPVGEKESVVKKTSVLSMKDMAAKRRCRRDDKSFFDEAGSTQG